MSITYIYTSLFVFVTDLPPNTNYDLRFTVPVNPITAIVIVVEVTINSSVHCSVDAAHSLIRLVPAISLG